MGRQLVVASLHRPLWSASGDRDPKNCSSVRGTFHQNLAAVILHNLLHDRKSKPGTVFFAEAYKGMKQFVLDRLRNAGTVVRDGNRDGGTGSVDQNLDSTLSTGRCLTCVQQKIV